MTAPRTPRGRALWLSGAALAMTAASGASAQVLHGGVDISVSAEAVSNPYLEQGNRGASVAGTVEVRPWLSEASEVTSFDLRGFAQVREFSRDYDREENFGANAFVSHRANERLTVTGRAAATSTASRRGISFARPGEGIGEPTAPELPLDPTIDPDVTLLGDRGRSTTLSAGTGAAYVIDTRHTFSVDFGVEDRSYETVGAQDFFSLRTTASATRAMDETTTVGTTVSFSKIDYSGAGDARSIMAFANVDHRLDERWTLQASAGVAFTRIEAAGATPRRNITTLATDSSLCRGYPDGRLCFTYSRMPEPTAVGGVRTTNTANMVYYRRLSIRNSVSATVGYSRVGASSVPGSADPRIEYLSASAMFERVFSERLNGFVRASSSRAFRPGLSIEPSVAIAAGITLRLGRLT